MKRWEDPCSLNGSGHLEKVDWTPQENKCFENALAMFGNEWEKIAAQVPGKTPQQVEKHYQSLVRDVKFIDSGRVPIPVYRDDEDDMSEDDSCTGNRVSRKGPVVRATRTSTDQERRKGIPWTEDEHRLFLLGLNKYGKGDWRSISRNYVVTRTPTQVASHAQKYFNRLNNSGGKERRRPSIHDIRNVTPPINNNNNNTHLPSIIHVPNMAMGGPSTSDFLLPNPTMPGPTMPGPYDYYGLMGNYPSNDPRAVSSSYPPPSAGMSDPRAVSSSYPPNAGMSGLGNFSVGPGPSQSHHHHTSYNHQSTMRRDSW